MSSQMRNLAVSAPDLTTAAVPVYANVAHVTFTPYDFRVTFSLLTLPHDRAPGPGSAPDVVSLTPRAVAQVVLPAGAVDSVIDLLRAELDRFVEQFGPPQPTAASAAIRS